MPKDTYKKALKILARSIEKHTSESETSCDFCNRCPAAMLCEDDHCFDDGNCMSVILKWAREIR